MNTFVRTKLRRTLQINNKKLRLRERTNLSFYLVVFFFMVFGLILIVELFFIEEKSSNGSTGDRAYLSENDVSGSLDGKPLFFRSDYDELINGAEVDRLAYVLGEVRDDWKPEDKKAGKDTEGLLNNGHDYREAEHLRADGIDPIDATNDRFTSAPPAIIAKRAFTGNTADLEPIFPNSTARDATWQPVGGTRYKFFVYSAYHDSRVGEFIRVIAATKTKGADRIWCVFWHQGSKEPNIVPGAVKVIRENWNLKYSACFVMCPLHSRTNKVTLPVPVRVSVTSKPNASAAIYNLLHVHHVNVTRYTSASQQPVPEYDFSVCVKPLHFDYNNVLQLVEFIELNALMGVQQFTFYNHTIGPQANCLLHKYMQDNLVQVYPWRLDMVSQKEIRTEGLFAALNDCLYRQMYRSRFLLLIDLDEYILPHQNDTLNRLLLRLSHMADPKTIGSYSFQNAFFYLQWPDDPQSVKWPPLLTQKKTRRRAKLHPHKQRSKYICVPPKVVEAGNHFVWEMIAGARTLPVPPDAGFLHHYRVCEFGGDDCIKSASVVDRSAHRFKDRLIQRVTSVLKDNEVTCGLGDILSELEKPSTKRYT